MDHIEVDWKVVTVIADTLKVSCTRDISWCCGHRVLHHEGKCSQPHGHEYKAQITASPIEGMDRIGRVVDFGVLKGVYQEWVDEHWDHGFIVNHEDQELIHALVQVRGAKVYELSENPTAENLAKFLLTHEKFKRALATYGVEVTSVTVHETPKCSATASITKGTPCE